MREWQGRIGFKPRKIRHWSPSWQHSSSGAISSYLWVLSLIVASWGAHTQFTFQKYPFFRPSQTPSGNFSKEKKKSFSWLYPAGCCRCCFALLFKMITGRLLLRWTRVAHLAACILVQSKALQDLVFLLSMLFLCCHVKFSHNNKTTCSSTDSGALFCISAGAMHHW